MLQSLADQIAQDLAALRTSSRFRHCQGIEGSSRINILLEGRACTSFCSNDYLGLASDPRLQKAASEAASTFGFGAGASRLVSGTHAPHTDLESAIAAFLGMPSALLYPTGYQANIGVISALAGPDDLIVADRAVHSSILDGCRLTRAKLAIYPHLDAHTAERHLSRLGPARRRRFLITESLFSMDGDIAPLSDLAALAAAKEAALIVDEAHALGCLGPGGRGLCAEYKVLPDVIIGTFGKAFGTSGAFACGTSDLRAYLVNHSRTFIFTTAPPIPVAAASSAALKLVTSNEGERLRGSLTKRSNQLHSALGLPKHTIASPILPIILGSDKLTLDASEHLRSLGFFVQAIRPPTVQEGSSRLRITLSSAHSEQQVADLALAIKTIPGQVRRNHHHYPNASSLPVNRPSDIPAKGIFLLGTDTGVGKTSVAVALLHLLAARGTKPVPFKPVETGATPLPADAARLLAASLREDIPLGVVCPFAFPEAIAPAAASSAYPLSLDQMLTCGKTAASYGGPMVVESAGGILTPYAPALTSMDLAVAYNLPVLLVARNSLGTINHTTLAVAEIRRHKIPFLGTVLVNTTEVRTPDQDTNLALINAATGQRPLGVLPYVASPTPQSLASALSAAVDLGEILEQLTI